MRPGVEGLLYLFAVFAFGLLMLLMSDCAPTEYYITESRTTELAHNWASSEGSITKLIRLRSPGKTRTFDVWCDNELRATYTVPADGLVQFYLDVPARYGVGDACYVREPTHGPAIRAI